MSQKYIGYGKILRNFKKRENRFGKWISKSPFISPWPMHLAASSAEIKAGILKSLIAVAGVLTKPGQMT
jgi:hypothetical protein